MRLIIFFIFTICLSSVFAQSNDTVELAEKFERSIADKNYSAAEAAGEQLLSVYNKSDQKYTALYVLQIFRLGQIKDKLKKHTEAENLFITATKITQKQTPLNRLNPVAYSNLAYHYRNLNKHQQSEIYVRKAIEADEIYSSGIASTRLQIDLAFALFDQDKCAEMSKVLLTIQPKASLEQDLSDKLMLSHKAMDLCFKNTNQNLKAIEAGLHTIEIADKIYGSTSEKTAIQIGYFANSVSGNKAILDSTTEMQTAIKTVIIRGLQIADKMNPPNDELVASLLKNLTFINTRIAAVDDDSLAASKRLLKILEAEKGSESSDVARQMIIVGMMNFMRSEFDSALKNLEAAKRISASKSNQKTFDGLINDCFLSMLYVELGNSEKAINSADEIIKHAKNNSQLSNDENFGINTLVLSIYRKAGATERTIRHAEALASSVTLNNGERPNRRQLRLLYEQLAWVYSDFNICTAADKYLRLLDKNYPPAAGIDAINRKSLKANVFICKKSLNSANKTFENFIPKEAAHFGVNSFRTAESLSLYGTSLGFNKKTPTRSADSIAVLKISVNITQSLRERVSLIDRDTLRQYTKAVAERYQILAYFLTSAGRLSEAQLVLEMLKEEEQFEFIRRSEKSDPRNTRIGYNSSEKAWVDRYQAISDKLAALGAEDRALKKQAGLGLTSEQVKRQKVIDADLKVAQAAFESFLSKMTSELARGGVARSTDVLETSEKALAELRDLLKSLGDGVVLLQIYVTDDHVNFLLTTPGVQLARSFKIKAQDLNSQIAQFRRELRDPKSDPRPAAQAMYQLLIGPVAQDLEQAGAKTVMLSLDGALRYLPFSALHDGKTYLNQRYSLPIYTSVAKGKLREGVSPQWQAVGLGVTRKLGDFDPLPGVKSEMNGIVRTAGGGALPGEVYLDEAFTAQRLRDVSQRKFPVMHVASHFRFSPGTEANSFLLLGDGSQLTLGDIRTQNYRFDNVDLLTLSACETGLGGGRDATGKEIEGFGVIAQQQGAKAVLATLWPVADQSTALLMADMYRKRQGQSLNKAEALRQAQIALQGQPQYAHPYYWAPFILMGNWK